MNTSKHNEHIQLAGKFVNENPGTMVSIVNILDRTWDFVSKVMLACAELDQRIYGQNGLVEQFGPLVDDNEKAADLIKIAKRLYDERLCVMRAARRQYDAMVSACSTGNFDIAETALAAPLDDVLILERCCVRTSIELSNALRHVME